ncbi:type III effector protein [Streptomyces sp. P17]|uniref:type III effector protein n=1 Tax=Streptomyces sp. P17 TaxID=3074716 RepID=UPI0028F42A35|nr:type III effector protein [Streptomyces sp. P17]MDT9695319.1 type III effector protein [Streptomyces sp. P17]
MTAADRTRTDLPEGTGPASFLAAAAALSAIDEALRAAHDQRADAPHGTDAAPGPEQVLASLLLLREVRERLAGWETDLIETAREAGASWADLAHPLGVTSRQAAERRYLRLRPGAAGTTGEQRVKATRDHRAANRSVTSWARANAAGLRRLAGQITALPDLPAAAHPTISRLNQALADNDAARLLAPLEAARPHLPSAHADLAAHIDTITGHTERLRHASHERRRGADGR